MYAYGGHEQRRIINETSSTSTGEQTQHVIVGSYFVPVYKGNNPAVCVSKKGSTKWEPIESFLSTTVTETVGAVLKNKAEINSNFQSIETNLDKLSKLCDTIKISHQRIQDTKLSCNTKEQDFDRLFVRQSLVDTSAPLIDSILNHSNELNWAEQTINKYKG